MKRRVSKNRRTVIVDFSRGSIKMALAETACEAVRFRGITVLPSSAEGEDSPADDHSEVVARIRDEVHRNGWKGMPCACLLSRSATSTQSFAFPPMPDAEMRQAIELKLEGTLHFDLGDACFDYRRVREYEADGQPQVLTLVAAARKDAVSRAVETLRAADLVPVAIGAAAESLANLAYLTNLSGDDEATVSVEIGSKSSIINLFEGRLLRFSREIDIAGDAITQAFMRPIIGPEGVLRLTYEEAERLKVIAGYPLEDEHLDLPHGLSPTDIRPLVEPVLLNLAAEIQRSCGYLRNLLQRPHVDRIILSGPSGRLRNLDSLLEENLSIPVSYTDPVARAIAHWRLAICDRTPSAPAGFAAILGYSLGNNQPINLLPRRERLRQSLSRAAGLSRASAPLAAALCIFIGVLAVPAYRDYGVAEQLLEEKAASREERTRASESDHARLTDTRRNVERIAGVRGLVPDWSGLLRELAAILPESVQLTSLRARQADTGLVIDLEGHIHASDRSFGESLNELTTVLGESPFFRNARVFRVDAPSVDSPGNFEATMAIVAGCPLPGEVGS